MLSQLKRISLPPAVSIGHILRLASAAASFRRCQRLQSPALIACLSPVVSAANPPGLHRALRPSAVPANQLATSAPSSVEGTIGAAPLCTQAQNPSLVWITAGRVRPLDALDKIKTGIRRT